MAPGVAQETAPFHLTDVDRQVLSQTDEEFLYHDWENIKEIIARNDLAAFKRKPSDLIRYIDWTRGIKAQYGTITNYICQRRLKWTIPPETVPNSTVTGAAPTPAVAGDSCPVFPFKNPIPFADPADYKILRNDWPYGVTPDISHLVVWLRTPVPVKENGGDVTDDSRACIEAFVQRTFVDRLAREKECFANPAEHVVWFKNWTALQSVRALEHVHILLRDVPEHILVEWTGEKPQETRIEEP
ncbi:hypothetical protein ASPZODRAFT_65037 [Penicilliopsis zonata CBS 506.65]|uniref:N-acetylglucosamine-induced protein 1 n=1 Tax=Penicilliopsis zonata CBS 506.65 TaxID=1073090 RepID=A0A1L9SJF0_9EURO|nr:hypothetical protein ASPZODRAFT_65037 [Penicilliopsis zonata CBS 506.65]OJJ47287.1 hypothetical protein ASPZODRAFT_65037 [Penicilliopsis zonata CBS 506.65]